jgi:hypothetical protein
MCCELWLTCHWIVALDDSDIQIIKTYASLGVTIVGLCCELWLTCHWIALDDSDIQIIKTYASLGVTIVGSCLRSHM